MLAAALFSACGGEDRGRPEHEVVNSMPEASDPCLAADGLTLQSITTFDPPDGANRSLAKALCDPFVNPIVSPMKRECMYFNADLMQSPRPCTNPGSSPGSCLQSDGSPMPDTLCMTLSPTAMMSTIPVTTIPGGRCGSSNQAFHLVGTNIATCYDPSVLKQGWGATLQITFNPSMNNAGQAETPLDAHTWDGVSFWGRRGSGPNAGAIIASIQDIHSAATNSLKPLPEYCNEAGVSPSGASTCLFGCAATEAVIGNGGPPDANKCDPFGLGVLLTPEWSLVKLPFSKVKQKGFGVPSPLGHLDSSALVGLQLAFSAGNWDVWIDDIAFYREP